MLSRIAAFQRTAEGPLQPVGTFRQQTEEMHLASPRAVPGGKLCTSNHTDPEPPAELLGPAYPGHSIMVGHRDEIQPAPSGVENQVIYPQRAVRHSCVAMQISDHL